MGMNSGKSAFWTPVALIRRSMSACMSSQMAYAHGRMTMLPRAGPVSASSARATTSWYHWGKFSPWGVSTASLATMGSASFWASRDSGGSLEQRPRQVLAVSGGEGVVVAEQAEDVQRQRPGRLAGLARALADGGQQAGQGRVGLAVGGLGGGRGGPGGRVGRLGGPGGGGPASAQAQTAQPGPGGQVVGVLLQDLAPAGGGLLRVELGRGRGGP